MGKFYAVKIGKLPGIYKTWDECKENTSGFPGAVFHSFKTLGEAEKFIDLGYKSKEEIKINTKTYGDIYECIENVAYAYVDGSFNCKTLTYGYGVHISYNGEICSFSGSGIDKEMVNMRNVAGEIMGSIKAVEKAIELGSKSIVIYYDYLGIEKWANDEWRAKLKHTQNYQKFIQQSREKIDIVFVKVEAHSGVEGNEIADTLAKQGCGIII